MKTGSEQWEQQPTEHFFPECQCDDSWQWTAVA